MGNDSVPEGESIVAIEKEPTPDYGPYIRNDGLSMFACRNGVQLRFDINSCQVCGANGAMSIGYHQMAGPGTKLCNNCQVRLQMICKRVGKELGVKLKWKAISAPVVVEILKERDDAKADLVLKLRIEDGLVDADKEDLFQWDMEERAKMPQVQGGGSFFGVSVPL